MLDTHNETTAATITEVRKIEGLDKINRVINCNEILSETTSKGPNGFGPNSDHAAPRMTPLAGSTRPLIGGAGADPAQVGFSADGGLLVVTEKLGNRLDSYIVGADGLPSAPIPNPSNGLTPFGFAFRGDVLVVSEAFGGMPNQGKASSYNAPADGTLNVISGSVPDFQTAACWVVITNDGKLVFVSNTGSGSIRAINLVPQERLVCWSQ